MNNDFWSTSAGNGPVRIALTGALALLALFLLVEAASVVQNFGHSATTSQNTIVVSGSGKVTALPDTAMISYRVTNTAPKVSVAQEETTKTGDAALAVLKKQGIADIDIKTTSYSINPHYEYRPCVAGTCPPAKITGYNVTQAISVKVRDTKKVGALLAGLGSVGVTNLTGPNFIVGDTTTLKNQARAKAITQAKAQAVTLASQLGVRLVRITNFVENSNTQRPTPILFSARANSVGENVPTVPIGENEYTENVSITYEIQ